MEMICGIGFNDIIGKTVFHSGTNRVYSDLEYRLAFAESSSALVSGGILVGNRLWMGRGGGGPHRLK
jgi:hypothetical protein